MFSVVTVKIRDKVYYQIKTPENNDYCGLLGIKGEAIKIKNMLNDIYFGENPVPIPDSLKYGFN